MALWDRERGKFMEHICDKEWEIWSVMAGRYPWNPTQFERDQKEKGLDHKNRKEKGGSGLLLRVAFKRGGNWFHGFNKNTDPIKTESFAIKNFCH